VRGEQRYDRDLEAAGRFVVRRPVVDAPAIALDAREQRVEGGLLLSGPAEP